LTGLDFLKESTNKQNNKLLTGLDFLKESTNKQNNKLLTGLDFLKECSAEVQGNHHRTV